MKRSALLLVACGLTACSDVPPRAAGPTLADSAGVRIVTTGRAALEAAPRWSLAPAPDRTLGGEAGSSGRALHQVAAVLPLPGERVAVLNAGSHEVVVFDAEGRVELAFGRSGDGPGEFRRPTSLLHLPPDSMAVYDTEHHRLSVFGPTGVLLREATLATAPPGTSWRRLLPLASGDLVLFSEGGRITGRVGSFRADFEALLLAPDGTVRGSLGTFPGPAVFVGQHGDAVAGMVLFGPTSHAATVDDYLVVGVAEGPEIGWYRPDGTLTRIVRWPDHDRTVSEERFDAFVDAVAATLPEDARPGARATLSQIPRSEVEPPYDRLLSAARRELWVARFGGPMVHPDAPSPAREWLVFGSDGALTAVATTPPGMEPAHIGEEELWGVFTDVLGVETARRYALDRSPEPGRE